LREGPGLPPLHVRDLGDYIREQRRSAEISLRQLSRLAGVSNPYLSQIERGLRRPSAEILQQIAKALRISAEALYVQAGMLDERPVDSETIPAIQHDRTITERQKQVLVEIYESFRRENDGRARAAEAVVATGGDVVGGDVAAAPDVTPAAPQRRRPRPAAG
jgi:transcriptional regulator with XRE-family HTH domain